MNSIFIPDLAFMGIKQISIDYMAQKNSLSFVSKLFSYSFEIFFQAVLTDNGSEFKKTDFFTEEIESFINDLLSY